MPRKPRVIIPNTPMHITQRGNRKEHIFMDDDDKEFYIKSFMKYRKKFKVKLFAWCLMDNHVHFIVQPSNKKGLSKLFLSLNTKYVRYFNLKYNIRGKLFGNRFYSCLLDEEHLFEAIRYVELNPFKANKEKKIGDYSWSSVLEHIGKRNQYYLNKLPSYIQIDNWIDYLRENIEELKEKWDQIRAATVKNFPLGNINFISSLEKLLKISFSLNPRGRPIKI
jgi:putative transposase